MFEALLSTTSSIQWYVCLWVHVWVHVSCWLSLKSSNPKRGSHRSEELGRISHKWLSVGRRRPFCRTAWTNKYRWSWTWQSLSAYWIKLNIKRIHFFKVVDVRRLKYVQSRQNLRRVQENLGVFFFISGLIQTVYMYKCLLDHRKRGRCIYTWSASVYTGSLSLQSRQLDTRALPNTSLLTSKYSKHDEGTWR